MQKADRVVWIAVCFELEKDNWVLSDKGCAIDCQFRNAQNGLNGEREPEILRD